MPVNSSLLKRMRVRLSFPEPLATDWDLPFPNWLHLVDPPVTSTIGELAASIASKWQPPSSSDSPSSSPSSPIVLSIGGYRLNPSDSVDILRDDDVVDVLPAVTSLPVSANRSTPRSIDKSFQTSANHDRRNGKYNSRKRLSIHHADRSGFGLDASMDSFDGVSASCQSSASAAAEEAAASAFSASAAAAAPVYGKRKASEVINGVEAKPRKQRKPKSDLACESVVVTAEVANGSLVHGSGVEVDPVPNNDGQAVHAASDAEKTPKKKRTRRKTKKNNRGFDLTLPQGGVSQWETVNRTSRRNGVSNAATAAVRIPFKMGVASNGGAESGAGRSHIVFGEEEGEAEFEGSGEEAVRTDGRVEEDEGGRGAKDAEETTEGETAEEEEEETDESKREKAIGEEDVDKWDPISQIPKEGDVVAFKVMEMDDHYCPQISDYKVGVVKSQTGKDRLQIRLFNFTRKKLKGKFEMRLKKNKKKFKKGEDEMEEEGEGGKEEENEGEDLVTENQVRKSSPEMTIQWNSVIEPKLRPADGVAA